MILTVNPAAKAARRERKEKAHIHSVGYPTPQGRAAYFADTDIVEHPLSAAEKRLLHVCAEYARRRVAKVNRIAVSPAELWAFRDPTEAGGYHCGDYGIGVRYQEFADAHDDFLAIDFFEQKGLESILERNPSFDVLRDYPDASTVVSTLVHEYAHHLFWSHLYVVIRTRLPQPITYDDPFVDAINEGFACAVTGRITGEPFTQEDEDFYSCPRTLLRRCYDAIMVAPRERTPRKALYAFVKREKDFLRSAKKRSMMPENAP